jgi:trk system potassium uptake protein TrkH
MEPPIADMSPGERTGAAIFQVVSARSAGLRTAALDAGSLSPASSVLLVLLMFIGGAPGSAAGGVSVLAVTWMALARIRRRLTDGGDAAGIAGRQSVRVVLWMAALVAAVTGSLCLTERGVDLLQLAFESVSAVGNCGFSMGLTPRLSVAGRAVVILAMLAGRVLCVTLVAALWHAGELNEPDAGALVRASV